MHSFLTHHYETHQLIPSVEDVVEYHLSKPFEETKDDLVKEFLIASHDGMPAKQVNMAKPLRNSQDRIMRSQVEYLPILELI